MTIRLILTLAILSTLTAGCGGLINNKKEVEIGRGVDVEIEKEYAIVAEQDPVAVWARELIVPLSEASTPFRDPKDIEGYKVEVLADDALVNAFAAPGGYTYLSTGLILAADTCAEITGVVGHELAHVTERHSVQSMEAAFAGQQLAQLFLGDGLASDAAQTVWAFLNSTQFSQMHESEADEVGLQIAHDAGYNPHGLADFFGKILALEKAGGSPPKFLSSHPATADRILAVEASIADHYGDEVVKGQSQSYACKGTKLQLEAVKKHLLSGAMKVRAGTGK